MYIYTTCGTGSKRRTDFYGSMHSMNECWGLSSKGDIKAQRLLRSYYRSGRTAEGGASNFDLTLPQTTSVIKSPRQQIKINGIQIRENSLVVFPGLNSERL